MLNKSTLAAAHIRPGELAKIADVSPNTVSRYFSDGPQHIEPSAALKALIYVLTDLPDDDRARYVGDLLEGKHLGTDVKSTPKCK